jgi:hypothetical protein
MNQQTEPQRQRPHLDREIELAEIDERWDEAEVDQLANGFAVLARLKAWTMIVRIASDLQARADARDNRVAGRLRGLQSEAVH